MIIWIVSFTYAILVVGAVGGEGERSLLKNLNSMGERYDPCGTPLRRMIGEFRR